MPLPPGIKARHITMKDTFDGARGGMRMWRQGEYADFRFLEKEGTTFLTGGGMVGELARKR